jgi:hypothetical protein
MKNYLVLPVTVALVAAIMAGCISPVNQEQSIVTPMHTPQVSATTALPTPGAVITPADPHEPIIGTWRYTDSSGIDDRYEFDSHFRYKESVYSPRAQRSQVQFGSWYPNSYNSYELSSTYYGIHTILLYDREKDVIYDTKYPSALFSRYQGGAVPK